MEVIQRHNTDGLKPPLKWVGGKRWLVPILRPIWQPYQDQTLVEPFAGGLAIALGLDAKKAVLNDANVHLINLYRQIKKGLVIQQDLYNESEFYYEMRDRFNTLVLEKTYRNQEAAELFYFLVRTGFNGLCRFNSAGGFNVPFGQHRTIRYRSDFLEYQNCFRKWHFLSGDFEKIQLSGEEFVYADPPYDVSFTQYYREDFDWEDQERLALWLAKHLGPMVASNHATKRIMKLYRSLGFRVHTLQAPRRISCNGDRKPVLEMIALKGVDSRKSIRSIVRP